MKQETLTNERMARLREICIYIAENPEKVISEIKGKNCAYYTGSMMLHGVTCDEYRIDFALLDKFNRLKSLLAERFPHMEVQVIRKNTVRDDGPGWMIDRYSIAFLLINHKRNKQMEITSSEIDAVYRDLSRVNLLSRYLIKSKIKTIL